MNFIEGKIIQNGEMKFLSNEGKVEFGITDVGKLKSLVNKKVWLGIRPEDIYDSGSLVNKGNYSEINVSLEVVEPMGNEIFLYFALEGIQFVARIPAREKPQAGTRRSLLFDLNKLHFFDSESEKAV
jgi:multiple sugar transport system ATP-binding protein